MKRFILAMSVAVLLSACGSAVKLDNVSVEDKGLATSKDVSTPATTSSADPSGVASGGTVASDINAGSSAVSNVVAAPTSAAASPGAMTQAGADLVHALTPAQAAAISGLPRIIYFDYDSFAIRPEFQAAIEEHAKVIIATKVKRVMIEGHTDERGGREYNLALGQKRAESVRQLLSLLGVAESQIEAISFGKEKPAESGASEEAMAKNRRAEMSYR